MAKNSCITYNATAHQSALEHSYDDALKFVHDRMPGIDFAVLKRRIVSVWSKARNPLFHGK